MSACLHCISYKIDKTISIHGHSPTIKFSFWIYNLVQKNPRQLVLLNCLYAFLFLGVLRPIDL